MANNSRTTNTRNAHEEGRQAGRKAGAIKERARLKTILKSEHAMGRKQLADHLAFETATTSEEAIALLQLSPIEQANRREAELFFQEMNAAQNPDVGADLEEDDQEHNPMGAIQAARKEGLIR